MLQRIIGAMKAPHISVMVKGWDIRTGTTGEMVLDAARLAEKLGLDGIVAGDHITFFGYGNDGLQTLTACAAVTERVTLKTAVYILPLRHPVSVALQVASLDQLSLGRFILGVGIGGEDRHEYESLGIDPRTRGARADEALAVLPLLWAEDDVTFHGKHFRLNEVTVYPKPLAPVPIHVGGRSEAALVRAGRFGNGYTGIWQSVGRFREAQEKISAAAKAAGRDAGAVEPGMQFWCGVDPDRRTARAQLVEVMESMYRIPFERFEATTPHGTAAEVAAFIAPYVEAGARHVNLLPTQEGPEANVEAAVAVAEELRGLFA